MLLKSPLLKFWELESVHNICNVCNVQLNCNQTSDHYNGKMHKKKMLSTPAKEMYCETCSLPLLGLDSYNIHLRGKRHRDVLRNMDPWRYCRVCDKDFTSEDESTIHFVSNEHKAMGILQGTSETIIDYNETE